VFFLNTSSKFYANGKRALALPLPDVVPANVQDAVVDHLVSNISQNLNHVTTSIVGTARVCPGSSDNGHHDLALEMISIITYPSYGYIFTNSYENATTLWE
jgi:hypothetical protein